MAVRSAVWSAKSLGLLELPASFVVDEVISEVIPVEPELSVIELVNEEVFCWIVSNASLMPFSGQGQPLLLYRRAWV